MTPWDELIATLDRYAAASEPIPAEAEAVLQPLVEASMLDRSVDRELHAPDVARWLVGLALAHRGLRERDAAVDPARDAADLRLIATRWLHPSRPRS